MAEASVLPCIAAMKPSHFVHLNSQFDTQAIRDHLKMSHNCSNCRFSIHFNLFDVVFAFTTRES